MVLFDRANSTRQTTLLWTLAVAVEKQFPLVPFLEALADEGGGRWRMKVRGLAELIAAGVSIPDALEAVPRLLPGDTVALIRVGAQTGNLSGALREAAGLARRRSENNGMRFQGTLLYLCGLLFILAVISSFIMIWIIPKFKAIFQGFETRLPPLTEAVIQACDLGAAYWYLAVAFPLAIAAMWLVPSAVAEAMGWAPAWGRPGRLSYYYFPRFKTPHILRCLSIAVDAGRPLSDALAALAARHADKLLRLRATVLADEIGRGNDCWQSLYRARMLRPGEAAMLEAAERVGNLAWALRGMADGIERRAEYRYQVAMEFVHPALILVIGSVIGIFCVSMFLPVIVLVRQLS
jgi:type II secretory pathway component PulF